MSPAPTVPEGYCPNPRRVAVRDDARINFARAFHERLPGSGPTPLLELPELASDLGLERLWVKDESARLGTESYELLGASWALYRAGLDIAGRRPPRWTDVTELRAHLEETAAHHRVRVVDDGPFALAGARAAALLGFDCTVHLPATTRTETTQALDATGATVRVAGSTLDDALDDAVSRTVASDIVLSESAWTDHVDVPTWVQEGYVTVFEEVGDELTLRGDPWPDAIVVPLGSGALAAAAARHLRTEAAPAELGLIGVELDGVRCWAESAVAGERITRARPADSAVVSLRRGRPSTAATRAVLDAFDGFLAVSDDDAASMVVDAVDHGLDLTPNGAASLGALRSAGHRGDLPARSAVVVATHG